MVPQQEPHRCRLDVTRILPHLYQGSVPRPGGEVARCGFTVLVLAAQEYQPPRDFYPGVKVIRAPLDDSGRPMTEREWKTARAAAKEVAAAVSSGERALVTCIQGRNRSGLIVALACHLLTGESGSYCADRIRGKRKNALVNQWFNHALDRVV